MFIIKIFPSGIISYIANFVYRWEQLLVYSAFREVGQMRESEIKFYGIQLVYIVYIYQLMWKVSDDLCVSVSLFHKVELTWH